MRASVGPLSYLPNTASGVTRECTGWGAMQVTELCAVRRTRLRPAGREVQTEECGAGQVCDQWAYPGIPGPFIHPATKDGARGGQGGTNI